jgi:hypothetical protein
MVTSTLPAAPLEDPRLTLRSLVAQAGVPVTAGDKDPAGAEAGVELPPAAGVVPDEVGGADDVDDELDDDEQPATAARTISAAAAPRIPLPERSTLGNTPVLLSDGDDRGAHHGPFGRKENNQAGRCALTSAAAAGP